MINNYYDVFRKRNENYSRNFKQAVQTDAALNFRRFLNSSPDAIQVRINSSTAPFIRMATILEKETETKSKRFFLSQKSDNVQVGDFIYWNGTIWLTYMKSLDVVDAYDKFEALECKHLIKWIDSFGVVCQAPVYLVAQTDSTIKENFRTWNNMITPQPNKTMEIVTSRKNIVLGQKFLVDDTAWFVVESDYISVHNIIYLSLTEDKVDQYVDNVNLEIADYVDLGKFVIDVPNNNISLGIGNTYTFEDRVYLNGNLCNNEDIVLRIDAESEDLVSIAGKVITGEELGSGTLKVCLVDNENVFSTVNIAVSAMPVSNTVYVLEGDSSIKWGRTKVYATKKVIDGVSQASASTITVTDTNEVLESFSVQNASVTVLANDKNKTGTFTIHAVFEDNTTIDKEVQVISLWM